jgi:hypothetical protein
MAAAPPSPEFTLHCPGCGRDYPAGPLWFGCESCKDAGGFPHWLEVRYEWRIDRLTLPDGRKLFLSGAGQNEQPSQR